MIKTAFILGAGLGTRLRPLTFIFPKPLIPINGKPLIEYSIRHLIKTAGVKNIIINTHHLPEKYHQIIGSGNKFEVKIVYSHEPELLDTGGGLKNIEPLIENDTFIMHNGDIMTDVNLSKMLEFHKQNNCLATLLISKRHFPLHIKTDKNLNIKEIGSGITAKRKKLYAFCGIHILEPEIFKYIPKKTPISIITVYKELINKGFKIKGFPLGNAHWKEIGNIRTYRKTAKNKFIIKEKRLTQAGSQRIFKRIKTSFGSIISIQYTPAKKENFYYADVLTFLKNISINVPNLISNDPNKHRIITEDLGVTDLFSLCGRKINIQFYKKALDEIVKLHGKGKKIYQKAPFDICNPFNYRLYRWESQYFTRNCLKNYFKIKLTGRGKLNLYNDYCFLAKILNKEPKYLIHRDFQSKNIIIKSNKAYLIDFQGMRFGLPHYDLASLLYDPYVILTEISRRDLYNYYVKKTKAKKNFNEIYKYCAVQRLMQALGAYGYLGLKLEKKDFLRYIPRGVENLKTVLNKINGLEGLKHVLNKIN